MARGRKPKPTAVKDASGAHRKNPKRRNNREPKPPAGWPDCPPFIKDDEPAYEHWLWLCTTLDKMNILSQADFGVLCMTAVAYARWRELDQVVAGGNVTDIGRGGNVVQRPEAVNVHKYATQYSKLITELGLTPSSRSKIEVKKDDDNGQSGFDQIIARMGAGKN